MEWKLLKDKEGNIRKLASYMVSSRNENYVVDD
jgi:hypothetical protein